MNRRLNVTSWIRPQIVHVSPPAPSQSTSVHFLHRLDHSANLFVCLPTSQKAKWTHKPTAATLSCMSVQSDSSRSLGIWAANLAANRFRRQGWTSLIQPSVESQNNLQTRSEPSQCRQIQAVPSSCTCPFVKCHMPVPDVVDRDPTSISQGQEAPSNA